ncbi:MAG: uracil-DNA glycosylase [Alphaproteobacteria bacterium]|nr:uracil-DNA glycosylase [Alphaproteobacteria bacterium]|tara:strand:+ start:90 stop:971 length:882 start_codon:yes stop_codon:yes gene_type:complete
MNERDAALKALEWYTDNGVTEVLESEPQDKTIKIPDSFEGLKEATPDPGTFKANIPPETMPKKPSAKTESDLISSKDARAEAENLVKEASTLEELRKAIADFEGLSVKKTALNMVFCDGNPKAKVMVIGEAPGADEDKQGKPFVGASGQLLDKILGSIGLSREAETPDEALYISNILNWRPPGNRTPTPAEMSIALPFIEKHIALISPDILVLVGNTPMKTLLNTKEGIVKMRGNWHDYQPVSDIGLKLDKPIYALPTFHPAYLLRNPKQKKTVWADMLMLNKKRIELGISKA